MSNSTRGTRPTSPSTDELLARQASRLSLNDVATSSTRPFTPSTPQALNNMASSAQETSDGVKGYLGNAPKPFDGKRAKLIPFIQHVDMFVLMNPRKLQNELDKVLFTGSYLEGDAEAWFRPYLKDYVENEADERDGETTALFASHETFKKELRSAFGALDEEKEAEGQVMRLQQTGSVQEYATKFRGLIATLGWGEGVALPVFREGLKPMVKWELRNTKTKKLSAFIAEAIKVDNDIWEFQAKNRGYNPRVSHVAKAASRPNTAKTRQPYYGPMPMDLDAAQRKPSRPKSQKKGNWKKGDKLSKEEREKRFRDKLCLYCGKPGHIAKDCKGKTQMSAAGKQATKTEPQQEMGMAEPRKETSEESQGEPTPWGILWEQHAHRAWTACLNDDCPVHLPDKEGANWYPRAPGERTRTGPLVMTFDNGKARYLALTATAMHVVTHYWRNLTCERPECTKEKPHDHIGYDPGMEKQDHERIVKLQFCQDPECEDRDRDDPDGRHVHQSLEEGTVNVVQLDPEPEEPEMNMAEPQENTSPTLEDHEKVSRVFQECGDRGALTPKVIETVRPDLFVGYYSCKGTFLGRPCLMRHIPHVHKQHYDPTEPERLGMPLEEARKAMEEQGNGCDRSDCHYATRHLHWPKNEENQETRDSLLDTPIGPAAE